MHKVEVIMNSKFLYGKKEFLEPIINGSCSPRFSDISHYARLENEKMRDDEMYKNFHFDKNAITITVNNHVINSSELASNPIISLPVQHCYCLCLTANGNNPELFETFNADICIEINVKLLEGLLASFLSVKLEGSIIEGREVKYYNPMSPPQITDPKELVFFKPDCFQHESEYRITIFYPPEKNGFKSEEGITLPFSLPNESLHLTFHHVDESLIQKCIVKVHERKNA